jgi:hypothetical protein
LEPTGRQPMLLIEIHGRGYYATFTTFQPPEISDDSVLFSEVYSTELYFGDALLLEGEGAGGNISLEIDTSRIILGDAEE